MKELSRYHRRPVLEEERKVAKHEKVFERGNDGRTWWSEKRKDGQTLLLGDLVSKRGFSTNSGRRLSTSKRRAFQGDFQLQRFCFLCRRQPHNEIASCSPHFNIRSKHHRIEQQVHDGSRYRVKGMATSKALYLELNRADLLQLSYVLTV